MPTTTTIRVIKLGSHRDLDPDERYLGAERAQELVGSRFGSADTPLAGSLSTVDLYDGNNDGRVEFDGWRGVNPYEYGTVDGHRFYADSGAIYRGTVTYMDGSMAQNVPLRVLQATDGSLVLLPPPSNASRTEIDGVTAKPIQSINLTNYVTSDFGGLDTSRYGLQDAPTFVCFCHGTQILTASGNVAVEDLRVGDMVITRDHGPQELRWIGRKSVDTALLTLFEKMRPVRIQAGALGTDMPQRDLYISQQHRILVSSKIAQRIFGEAEVLIAAKHLTEIDGIEIDQRDEPVEYFHLLFDRHEVICAEGAMTESLFTGPEALKSIPPEARSEILALFPDLLTKTREPARLIASGRAGRQLARRHLANLRELQAAPPQL